MQDALQRTWAEFDRQVFMLHLGARISAVLPGVVELELPAAPELAQHHGFVHAGAMTAVMDTACGLAALTTLPSTRSVLTAEFKVNLLRPARGSLLRVHARVVKSGRSLVICEALAHMAADDGQVHEPCAMMLATIASVDWTSDVA